MSTFIMISININEKAGTVHLTGYSSNVYPKKASRFESEYLSEMLTKQGREALDLYMLEQYQGGMIRGGSNEYANTIALYRGATLENLKHLRELKKTMKGVKYALRFDCGYAARITASRALLTPYLSDALQMDIVTAMIKAKRFNGAEVIPA